MTSCIFSGVASFSIKRREGCGSSGGGGVETETPEAFSSARFFLSSASHVAKSALYFSSDSLRARVQSASFSTTMFVKVFHVGVFVFPDGATTAPESAMDSFHSLSNSFGKTNTRRPMTPAMVTREQIPAKSRGTEVRSATSTTHLRNLSGRKSGLNGTTGKSKSSKD